MLRARIGGIAEHGDHSIARFRFHDATSKSCRARKTFEVKCERGSHFAHGDRFDRKAFNDFLLDQGLLPPDLLAKAVREQFIPQQKAKK